MLRFFFCWPELSAAAGCWLAVGQSSLVAQLLVPHFKTSLALHTQHNFLSCSIFLSLFFITIAKRFDLNMSRYSTVNSIQLSSRWLWDQLFEFNYTRMTQSLFELARNDQLEKLKCRFLMLEAKGSRFDWLSRAKNENHAGQPKKAWSPKSVTIQKTFVPTHENLSKT